MFIFPRLFIRNFAEQHGDRYLLLIYMGALVFDAIAVVLFAEKMLISSLLLFIVALLMMAFVFYVPRVNPRPWRKNYNPTS